MLRRAWWALLAIIHIAPLLGAMRTLIAEGPTGPRVVSTAALGLAFAFFLLKLLDVGFLRWRMRRASFLAFALTCVLVHDDAAPAAVRQAMLAELPTAIAVSVVLAGLQRTGRLIPRIVRRLAWLLRRPVASFGACGETLARQAHILARRSLVRPSIPRAPPA